METSDPKMANERIFLWTTPRSLSTILAKAIAHMDGAAVWQEPYVSVYFSRVFHNPATFSKFPGMKTVAAQVKKIAETIDVVKGRYEGGNLQPQRDHPFTFDYVKAQLEKPLPEGKKFLLVKDHAFGIDGHYDQLPKGPSKHTFLIRHPNRVSLSVRRVLANVYEYEGDIDEFDIGASPFSSWDMLSEDPLYRLWNYVRENLEPNPVVIDADDLQNHTGDVMRKYCEAVGIPWKDIYTTWPASNDYVKYLYGGMEMVVWGEEYDFTTRAHSSSRISPTSGDVPAIPACCDGFAAEFREGYRVMYEHRIKPDQHSS